MNVALGDGLQVLGGYPFEVRYSAGAHERARAAADIAAEAYGYFGRVLDGLEAGQPDLAVIVAGRADWASRQPYGLPFFNDDPGQIRPGIVVMPAGRGDFWVEMADDIRSVSPTGYRRLQATYPDGAGGVDLQPFFDLITLHELGHAFEQFGDLQLPTFWLGEIFANLALHTFVATSRPELLETLEALPVVGVRSRGLTRRVRAEGFSTLEELEENYTGGDRPMSAANYVWYQYRWQRIAARMFDAGGEAALTRFWACFRAGGADQRPGRPRFEFGRVSRADLARVLTAEVSPTLGRAVRTWR